MTARSRKQRDRNARIKRARNKPKELLRLKKTLGMLDADGNELMENVKDVVDEKTMEEIKKKQAEALIEQEFIEEMKAEIEPKTSKKRKIKVVNDNTKKEHLYDSRSLKDQHGSYPPWLNVGNHKRKMKKKATAIKKDFGKKFSGAYMPV